MPNVSLNVERFWTSAPYGYTTSVGIAVELPIFDRRQGPVDKTQAEARSATWRRELAEAKVKAEVSSYSSQVAQRSAALQDFQRRSGARLPQLKQMAEDSYRLGRTSIAELLDATRARLEIRLAQKELLAGLMDAQLKLEAARGRLSFY